MEVMNIHVNELGVDLKECGLEKNRVTNENKEKTVDKFECPNCGYKW